MVTVETTRLNPLVALFAAIGLDYLPTADCRLEQMSGSSPFRIALMLLVGGSVR